MQLQKDDDDWQNISRDISFYFLLLMIATVLQIFICTTPDYLVHLIGNNHQIENTV